MSDTKKISTNNFRIEKNVISFNDSLLQISNISQVDVAPVPKKKFNFLSIVALVIGFFLLTFINGETKTLGVIFIVGAIAYMIWFYSVNSNEDRYLNISLNSGNIYCIICRDKKFLEEVMKVIEYCINNHSSQKIQIDFNKCKMYNSPVIIGNRNEVH